MAVLVKAGATFEAAAPEVLFQTLFRQTVIAQYDVFPGGQRFIVNNVVTEKYVHPDHARSELERSSTMSL